MYPALAWNGFSNLSHEERQTGSWKHAFLAGQGLYLVSLARNEDRELSDVVDYSQELVCSLQMTQSPISTEHSAFQTNLFGELVLCCLTESVHDSLTLHLRADASRWATPGL